MCLTTKGVYLTSSTYRLYDPRGHTSTSTEHNVHASYHHLHLGWMQAGFCPTHCHETMDGEGGRGRGRGRASERDKEREREREKRERREREREREREMEG